MKKIMLVLMLLGINQLFAQKVNIVDAYKEALDFEAKLQSQKYQTRAKKEDIEMAKAALYPQIDLQLSATDRRYKLNYSQENRDEKYYTATLSARLALYKPENYNKIDQSRIKYQHSRYSLQQKQQELALDVADAYMSILRAQNSLLVASVYVDANQVKYNQIKSMYEKRLANRMDLLESKVTYESSKVKVNSEEHNLYLAKMKLKKITGLEEIAFPKIDLERFKPEDLAFQFSQDKLTGLNFEIRKSKLGMDLADKQRENAVYGHHPKVDMSVSLSEYDTNSPYTDYEHEARFMLNFKLPLYQGGYVESKIAQSKYLISAAQEDLRDVKKEVDSKYEELMIKLSDSKESIVLYKDAIASAELYLHAVEEGYAKGLKNLIDLEDAKTKLFENKFKLIDASYEYIKSYVSLLAMYGKLDKAKLEDISQVLSKE